MPSHRPLALWALAAALLSSEARADEPATRRFALLVGANDGGPYRVRLRYAHDDARQVGSVLSDLGGVAAVDRTLKFDPSVADLDAALDDLDRLLRAEPEATRTEVVFYFSGHSDAQGLLLGSERYAWADLRTRLEALPADIRVGVLDSCASGALIRGKGGRPVAPFLLDEAAAVSGSAWLTSASADEEAQEADAIGGSFFTWHLVAAMRGAADADADRQVTLGEAYRYAFDETLATTSTTMHGAQHATYDFDLSGTGEFVLTDLTRASAVIELAPELDAAVLVRDDQGRVVAEITPRGEGPTALGVAPGKYVLTLSKDGRYATVPVAVPEGRTVGIGPADVAWNDGELAVARGGTEDDFAWREIGARGQIVPEASSYDVIDHATFGLLAGRSGRLQGLALSFGGNFVDREVTGASLALGYNQAGGDVFGLQTALGANYAEGHVAGQLAVGANLSAGGVRGVQAAVGFNGTDGPVSGLQAAVGANIATEPVHGVQIAVGGNIAPRSVRGVQLSSGVNVAGGLHGGQIGLINVGGEVRGAQIGLINVGGRVHGLQIGLVNFAAHSPAPIGLLSFVKDGRHAISFYGSESGLYNVDLKLGGRYFHTILGAGATPGRHLWGGIGFGTQPIARPLFLDIDVSGLQVEPWDSPFQGVGRTWVARGRASVGLPFTKWLAVFAGASINARFWTSEEPVPFPAEFIERGQTAVVWPGFYAGVQLF